MSLLELSLRFLAEVTKAVVWPGAILLVVYWFRHQVRKLLNRLVRIEIRWGDLIVRMDHSLTKVIQRRMPEKSKDIPRIPEFVASPSAKERIMNEWQKVHDALTDVYEKAALRRAPANFKTLASRLKRRHYLTDTKVWAVIDQARRIYWRSRRARQEEVRGEVAEYYERVVELLLSLIADVTRQSGNA